MGSGTALLEAKLHSNFKEAYGVDINPLALLVSKVKTTPIDDKLLFQEYENIINRFYKAKKTLNENIETPDFFNIDYWFKKEVKLDLTLLKKSIESIHLDDTKLENDVKDFFNIVFSNVTRTVSNTRNGEYKLYRIKKETLEDYNPDTFLEFKKQAKTNIKKMSEFNKQFKSCKVNILDEDTRYKTSIPSNHVDIVVTSPPYGDSRTTVAYGQFSRLSLQWLGFEKKEVSAIDKHGLGGIPTADLDNTLNSPLLQEIIDKIAQLDEKRVKDVLSFYKDFYQCVIEIDRVMKTGGFLCFVVGNRTVKGVQIPTDDIIIELFKSKNEYKHHKTIIRNIPSKRLPKRNSPTNVKGKTLSTMNHEYIVILEKI
ncbi:Modification methylase MvaI (plasmid) [Methanobacterium congolense]|uniref:site-specific DNA-methyltransferase (cytosine-N(4)-specific) n=2 Tax=Methanobacterium congolense TaxID=118062 RepID=A0A1D3L5N5_9EURY|nr:Modification methylase MvaI [Methanobacterium congolense]